MIPKEKFVELANRFTVARTSDNRAIEKVLDAISEGHSVPSFGNTVEFAFLDLLAYSVANDGCSFENAKEIIEHFFYTCLDYPIGKLDPSMAKTWAVGEDNVQHEICIDGWGDIYDEITDWNEYFKHKTGVYPKKVKEPTTSELSALTDNDNKS